MDPALTQPCEHLLNMLDTFAISLRASTPQGPHAQRWTRATTHLDHELHRLRSLATQPAPNQEHLKQATTHLTQLARTQDGLRLDHSTATPPTDLADQRRLVVFAAWQLLQALDHVAILAGPK
jgi:hypothetical protein